MITFKSDITTETLGKIRNQHGTNYSIFHVRTGDTELRYGKLELAKWINAIHDRLLKAAAPIGLICGRISLKTQMSSQVLRTPGFRANGFYTDGLYENKKAAKTIFAVFQNL